MTNTNEMFYRIDENGNAVVFHASGEEVTKIDADVYPIYSLLSARYEHPCGIVLTVADAERIGIREEF